MHRRESRASIDIATAERSPRQAFLKTVERQQRDDLDAAPAKNASSGMILMQRQQKTQARAEAFEVDAAD